MAQEFKSFEFFRRQQPDYCVVFLERRVPYNQTYNCVRHCTDVVSRIDRRIGIQNLK